MGTVPTNLETLQRRVWPLMTYPTRVTDGATELQKTDATISPLTGWFSQRDEAQASERLSVYANMYFYRLLCV